MKALKLALPLGLLTLMGGALAQTAAAAPVIDKGDTAFMLIASALVLLMTPGLAFFYGGLARAKTVLNTMMMSFIAIGVVALLWPLIGYSIAFGDLKNAFFGGFDKVALSGLTAGSIWNNGGVIQTTIPTFVFMIFQMMFAVITPALISGALIDRMKFGSYILFIGLWSVLIYAPLAHWVWSANGWLFARGVLDFAGGTVVHIAAGISALVAVLILGPRSSGSQRAAVPHNIPFVLLGAALLWFGWFGFNAGSELAADGVAGLAFINTAIAPGVAMLAWLLCEVVRGQRPSAVGAATGAVVGLVAITPACAYVGPVASMAIGAIAAVCSFLVVQLKHRLAADDALDVFACHGVGGIVGAILTGVFADSRVSGLTAAKGLIDGNPAQIVTQLVGVGVTILFCAAGTAVLMFAIKAVMGVRVSAQEESMGLDVSSHAEDGYNNGDFGYATNGKSGSIDSPVILSANAND